MIDACSAFSGRLSIVQNDKGTAIDYCTGQYFPTEYRKAAAAVLERYVETVRPKTITGRIPETIAEMKEMNREAGFHFFDRDSMKFFRSRIHPTLYTGPGGVYFVTSEKSGFSDNSPRRFTVRQFNPQTASVDTVRDAEGSGEFGRYIWESDARQTARKLAKGKDA